MKTRILASQFAISAAFGVLTTLAAPVATAQVYKCETESGAVLYQNMPGRSCKAMDIPSMNTIAAPKLPVSATASPSSPATAVPVARNPNQSATTLAAASPAGFPRVDSATQKSRDSDRKRIIEDEWKKERAKLGDLEKEFNAGQPERRADERNFAKYEERVGKMRDELNRTKANIESLERELRSIN